MGILDWKFSFFYPLLLLHFVTNEKVDHFCPRKMLRLGPKILFLIATEELEVLVQYSVNGIHLWRGMFVLMSTSGHMHPVPTNAVKVKKKKKAVAHSCSLD